MTVSGGGGKTRALLRAMVPSDTRVRLPVVSALALSIAFIVLAQNVFEGETRRFDEALLLAFRDPADLARPLGPAWLQEVVRDITALGSTVVLTLIVAGLTGFLAITGRQRTALLILAAVVSGVLVSSLFKHGFARPRPDLVPHGTHVSSASFPSGHAMMSAIVYLTLGSMIAGTEILARARIYVLGCSAAVALLVGLSRVYLGVHWPTDVIAGWMLGIIWALVWSLVLRRLQQRGDVEAVPSEDLQGLS